MSTDPGVTTAADPANRKRGLRIAWTLMVIGVALIPLFGQLGGYAALPLVTGGVLSYQRNAQPKRYWFLALVLVGEFTVLYAVGWWLINLAQKR
jgi:hypothetical protein